MISPRRPKMISVQVERCAPIVRAFREGKRRAELWPDAHTIAPGIRVPAAIGDYLMLDAMGASRGTGVTVSGAETLDAIYALAREDTTPAAPEGAATYAGYRKLMASGFVKPEDKVVLLNTGPGLKTPDGLLTHNIPHWFDESGK